MTNEFDNLFSVDDKTMEYDTQDVADAKISSILAYFGVLFFLPLVCVPQSKFGRFHANQGLVFLIVCVVLGVLQAVVGLVLGWIPVIGAMIKGLVQIAVAIITLVLFLFGIINTAQGKAKELPLIGGIKILS